MKIKLIFMVLMGFPLCCFSMSDSLLVKSIQIGTGIAKKSFEINPSDEISLPVSPTFISITVDDTDTLSEPEYICVFTNIVSIYDTLYMGKDPSLNFFNLPGGDYSATFINLNNQKSVIQKFNIDVPFWEKWWFPPLVLLFITSFLGIIFYFIYRIQLRQKLRTQFIRDNIARDLHDDIGSYLSSISILSQSVDNMIVHNPDKARQSLNRIGDTARQVMDTMGDIVWSINPNHDSMPLIIQKMRDLASELFAQNEINVVFQADENIQKANLSLERRRDFFLIYKEALTNAQKYANASEVVVKLSQTGREVCLEVSDNGVGFDVASPVARRSAGGNGLGNMQTRTERLAGRLTIQSEPAEGTFIRLEFPL